MQLNTSVMWQIDFHKGFKNSSKLSLRKIYFFPIALNQKLQILTSSA